MEIAKAFDITRALTHGFEAFKRQPIGLLIGSFFLTITAGSCGNSGSGSNGLGEAVSGLSDKMGPMALVLAAAGLVCVLILAVAVWLFRSWLHPGYLRLHRALIVDGEATVDVLFSGGDAFGRTALWKLLSTGITIGTLVVAGMPGAAVAGLGGLLDIKLLVGLGSVMAVLLVVPASIYVQLGLALGNHAVVLEDLDPVPGLERSWSLAEGNRLHLLVFFGITWMAGILGLLACCVGIFATRSVVDVGITESFLLATRDDHKSFALLQEVHVPD